MMRVIFRAAASAALLMMLGNFCAADDYGTAPTPAPAPKAAPSSPGGPVFSEAQLDPRGGLAVNGLQLKLTADRLTLREQPVAYGEPLIVEPTTLHLIFTNVSEQPMVLDAFNLVLSRLSVIVVGPQKETVVLARKAFGFRSRAALPIDFPQVEPGNWFVPMDRIQFPGDFNLLTSFYLYLPGDYKVQVVYTRPADGVRDAWVGRVVSNTLTLRVAGPMPPLPPEKGTPEQPPETAPQPAPTPQQPPPLPQQPPPPPQPMPPPPAPTTPTPPPTTPTTPQPQPS